LERIWGGTRLNNWSACLLACNLILVKGKNFLFLIFWTFTIIANSDCQLRRVRLSVRMEQFGFHWTDFLMKFDICVFY